MNKELLKVRNIAFALMAGVALSGCDALMSRETIGEYGHDTGITTSVKSAIAAERSLHMFQISVETLKDVVQLSGFVGTQAEKRKAGEIAANVEGVKSVKNNLIVRK